MVSSPLSHPSPSPSLPHIAVGSLGGTISMTPSSQGAGVVPTLDAAQLSASVPGLDAVARISASAIHQLPSGSLTVAHIFSALRWAEEQVAGGARGVVLTQGTDTLEETAFLLDLHWSAEAPLIVTGAMRAPAAAGAEGPSNLLAAVQTAADTASAGRGVLVVMNDAIHCARWVTKADALAVQAFVSPDGGLAGRMVEGQPTFFHARAPRNVLPAPTGEAWPRVALVTAMLDDDGELAELAAEHGYAAVVVAALGAGHMSFGFAARVERIAPKLPVVIASRTGGGSTASRTYGYVGAEIDLQKKGALMAGWLSPIKARLLVAALLAQGMCGSALQAALERWSRP